MKSPVYALALVTLTAAGTAAVILPAATAQSGAAAVPAAAPSPSMVSGLPDFTRLVERVGPAVVNIEAVSGGTTAARPQQQQQQMPDEMPEFFRRFFGPGTPFPGMPQDPGGRRGMSMGTGFLISADGYVLTNHHVVAGADELKVKLSDRREFTAELVGGDEQSDVALLKIKAGASLPYLRAGNSAALKPGQWAVAIGSPFGLDQSVTAGIISAVGRSNPYANQRYVPFIQTDVAINRGNSGGPLLNTAGEVVGINSQIFSNSGGYMGVSFAIPIDVAMNVAEQLKTTGQVKRGQIGVQVQQITTDAASGLGLPDTLGALVADVVPGGPAEKAGLERGDVIREIDGTRVIQSSDLPPIVGAKAPGSRATLKVWRDGRSRDVTVTLGELDEGVASVRPVQGGAAPAKSSNPLGLVGQELSAAQRRQLELPDGDGVAIARVEGLAARAAGIQPGDVVLSVGRKGVGSPADLDRELAAVRPGQTVMLLVRNRSGGTQFIAVTPRTATE
ncbi:DegQ family serine endoprotease [Luteimonas sp. MC1825]|uniref:DegQ family serine endoprotease n=1 Tax=Luteimonas sp. MC1825 TaxID=2761107 RepID=UPI0016075BEB|nr:DegQ family serine endoprotease [Luteimonas sp. MC1825]QOC87415.1 DegQ family serine endoprotease [Luteimonas sp. MC1825]